MFNNNNMYETFIQTLYTTNGKIYIYNREKVSIFDILYVKIKIQN